MPPKFGYLAFQGRGQVLRLLLAYTQTPHEETTYTLKTIKKWLQEDKDKLGLDFPTLPYWIDGDFKLTESSAIERYICKKSHLKAQLLGSNSKLKALIDSFSSVLKDIFNELIKLFSSQNFETDRKATYEKIIQPKFQYISNYLGDDKQFFLDRVSYPDFTLSVMVEYIKFLFPHEAGSWTRILRVAESVKNLTEIQTYFSKEHSMRDLMFPNRLEQLQFQNIGPLGESEAQQAAKTEARPPKQQMTVQEDQQQETKQRKMKPEASDEQKPIQEQTQTQQSSPQKEKSPAAQTSQQQSGIKSISSRLQDYMKATEASNNKGTTPSKVQAVTSHLTTKSSENWLQNNQENQTNQSSEQNPRVVLGYWGIRGLGQIQRHLMSYCGVEFDEKIYKTQDQWFNGDKLKLGLPFPNLPYLIDSDLKLTESISIERYVIGQYGDKELLGKDLRDTTYIECLVKNMVEMFKELRVLCFTEDPEKQHWKKLQAKIEPQIQQISSLMKKEDEFVMGYLSWIDFHVAEVSHYLEKVYPEMYSNHPCLSTVRRSVENLEQVKKYYERETAIKAPFIPPIAKISF